MATEGDHHELTEHNELKVPYDGQGPVTLADGSRHDWHDDFVFNFETMDSRVIVPMTSAERASLTPTTPTWVYETDTDDLYYHDGTSWAQVLDASLTGFSMTVSEDGTQVGSDPSDMNFGTDLVASDDGDGSVTVDAATALTRDDSNETITAQWNFNDNVDIRDDVEFEFGTSQDFGLHYDSANDRFEITVDPSGPGVTDIFALTPTGDLDLMNGGQTIQDAGTTALSFDGTGGVNFPNGLQEGGSDVVTQADRASEVIERPNHQATVTLDANGAADDGDKYFSPIPIPNGQTATVYSWMVQLEDGTQPTDLQIGLMQPDRATVDTQVTSSSISGYNSSTAAGGLADYANSSGSFATAYVFVDNDSANVYDGEGTNNVVEFAASVVVE